MKLKRLIGFQRNVSLALVLAALICGGETPKLSAICGSEVEMIDESSPSMKNAPAMVTGTISGTFACGGSSFTASDSATIKGPVPTLLRPQAS